MCDRIFDDGTLTPDYEDDLYCPECGQKDCDCDSSQEDLSLCETFHFLLGSEDPEWKEINKKVQLGARPSWETNEKKLEPKKLPCSLGDALKNGSS